MYGVNVHFLYAMLIHAFMADIQKKNAYMSVGKAYKALIHNKINIKPLYLVDFHLS